MTDNNVELTRRKILASVGAIGTAGAGAGVGTTALYSDTESLEDNSVTAGELDLKVDWTEHYSDSSPDESETVEVRTEPDGTYDIGFPAAAPRGDQSVFVATMDDARTFLANTAIEAFPDTTADDPSTGDYDGKKVRFDNDSEICDVPADFDGGRGVLSHPYRTGANVDGGVTIGDGANPQTTEAGDPLVDISDVKPGDFGEVTFSFHLCGNPGYVWLTGELSDADENGTTEPEAGDADELNASESDSANLFDNEGDEVNDDGDIIDSRDPSDTVQERVELLDEIQAALWYDTGPDGTYGEDFSDKDDGEGDNYYQDGETFIAMTASLRNILEQLEGNMLPLDYKPVNSVTLSADASSTSFDTCTSPEDAEHILNSIDDLEESKPKNVSATELAEQLIENNYVDEGTEYIGTKFEVDERDNLSTGTYSTPQGAITIESKNVSEGTVTLSTNFPVEAVSVKGGNKGEREYVFETEGGTESDGEDEQFGSILDSVTFRTPDNKNGKRAALSNVELCYDDPSDDEDGDGVEISPGETGQECFPNSTTAYIGFEWWVPRDVGNEIQGDSVSFDLGFYTEQCRNNDDPGQTMN